MSKNTPGPWIPFACRYSDSETEPPYLWQIRQESTGDIVATTAQYGVHSGAPLGRDERAANAAMLAAAPELLAALIALDEAFCNINEFSTREERSSARAALINARAAITKAKGG